MLDGSLCSRRQLIALQIVEKSECSHGHRRIELLSIDRLTRRQKPFQSLTSIEQGRYIQVVLCLPPTSRSDAT